MKSLVVLLVFVVAVSAVSFSDLVLEEWNTFKLEHNKQYDSKIEDKFRMKVYARNKLIVAKHNQQFERGLVSYRLKINEYSDMTHHEFVNTMNGFNRTYGCLKMKSLVVLLVFVVAVSAVSFLDLVLEEWNTFKLEHNKQYDSKIEDKFRMKVYVRNKLIVAKHNQQFERGLVSYRLKINEYSDMTHHEFVNTMNGFNRTYGHNNGMYSMGPEVPAATFIPPVNFVAPSSVDWRQKGAITPVKNQGHCGSCWSFSATGALEGQHFRKTGILVSLSEQNLIDCSRAYGNHGCKGGWMDNAFRYIKENGGIDTEKTYPYEAVNKPCRYERKNSGAYDVGLVDLPKKNENTLKLAIAAVGPVSVAIDASHVSFQQYSDGVHFNNKCSTTKLHHAVLVVGYGTDKKGGDYWLVKNSWGKSWGENGYIRMARNRRNNCGIASHASYPLV